VIALVIRPWRLACAVTALRAAFPGAKVHIDHYDRRAAFADFAVSQPVTITDTRELLTMSTSWAPRRLRITAEIFTACPQEAGITALIAAAAPKMERGTVVVLGELLEKTPKTTGGDAQRPRFQKGTASPPSYAELNVDRKTAQAPIQRGPRLGRRVSAEELQPLLRGLVIR